MLCVVDQSHDQYPVSPRLLLVSSGQLRSAALWPGRHCVTRPHVGDDTSFTSVYTHVLIEYVECEELSVNVSVFIWAYQRLQWDTLSLVSQLSIVTFHYYQSFSLSSTLLQPAPACCKLWHSKKLKDTSFKANKKFHHQVFPGVGWCKYKNVFSGLVTEGGDDMVDMVGWLGWPVSQETATLANSSKWARPAEQCEMLNVVTDSIWRQQTIRTSHLQICTIWSAPVWWYYPAVDGILCRCWTLLIVDSIYLLSPC